MKGYPFFNLVIRFGYATSALGMTTLRFIECVNLVFVLFVLCFQVYLLMRTLSWNQVLQAVFCKQGVLSNRSYRAN